ncbi:MAG: DUF488 domain-containing protein [Verrucomicrobia bacterium]|nr:DUF488 domain-containing protein [Verrucomicrobiota bacterium]
MLFERQRVLLTLLDALGGQVSPTDFQKLLFLYTRNQKAPSYEFVPYKFGCFSFSSYADKRRLIEQGLLENDADQWKLTPEGRATIRKGSVNPMVAARFNKDHAALRGNELVAEVYRKFPYYASRSEIVDKVLKDKKERELVAKKQTVKAAAGLLTIGYEGKCLETYLNQLLRAGVTVLCDVRRNPLSRKYGFSKTTLRGACESLGIRYEHLPELGIPSEERRELKTQADYDALFEGYERDSLPLQTEALATIRSWIKDGESVALTCFELHPHQCHRHCVAEALETANGKLLKATHL